MRHGAFGQADQDPVALRRLQPGVQFFFTVLQWYDQRCLAGSRGRLEFDQRNAVLADTVAWITPVQPGQWLALEVIDVLLCDIRRFHDEFADQSFAYRAVVPVIQAHRNHRRLLAVGEQTRLFVDQFGAHRQVGHADIALNLFDQLAVRIANF